jgi:dihydrofolate reductase
VRKIRKIILYMTMTMDGFLSGPNGELDWFDPSKNDSETIDDIVSILDDKKDTIMGYPTGPGLMAYWREVERRGQADEWEMRIARSVNKIHPIIITNKKEKEIDGVELILAKDDAGLVNAVNQIRQQKDGNIIIFGGVRTAQNFSRLGLIDEYVLMVHPIAISEGRRLFTGKTKLELLNVKPTRPGW